MQDDFKIRKLYRPVQPTVKQTGNDVSYIEFLPAESLQNLIYCYWELKTIQRLEDPFIYRVIADGCIDIFFQLGDPTESFVMGFCKQYTEFPLENSFHYIGIRFFPTAFPSLFNIKAKELNNRYEKLDLVVKGASDFIQNKFSAKDDSQIIVEKLDDYFMGLLNRNGLLLDARLKNALHFIMTSSGSINIQKDLDVGLSPRHLRRYFDFYVGGTAKNFSQVIRFQHILKSKPSVQSIKSNKVFFDLGYYDQAHFIKEFKNFYGATPSRTFKG